MAASSASNEAESRRRPARPKDKGVVDFAADAAKDIATLLQTELQLLRAEISEKLTFTAMYRADRWRRAPARGDDCTAPPSGHYRSGCLWSFLAVGTLIVAAVTLVAGAAFIWLGINRLNLARLAPSKTLDQLQKDSNIANTR